ncbi:TPA: hypothetical protein ACPZSR_001307 [Yersinia enterocolitica]
MKELNSFTVEQLNDFIKSDHTQCGDVAALARIALAAKRAEESHSRREVWDGGNTWIQCSRQAYDRHEAAGKRVRVLYERPQLNSPEITTRGGNRLKRPSLSTYRREVKEILEASVFMIYQPLLSAMNSRKRVGKIQKVA